MFNVSVARAVPKIDQILLGDTMSRSSSWTGTVVVSGFPFPLDASKLKAQLANRTAAVRSVQQNNADAGHRLLLTILFPPVLSPGLDLFVISYPASDSGWPNNELRASLQLSTSLADCALTCVSGCEASMDAYPAVQVAVLSLYVSAEAAYLVAISDVVQVDCRPTSVLNNTSEFCSVKSFQASMQTSGCKGGQDAAACLEIRVLYTISAPSLSAGGAESTVTAPSTAALLVVTCSGLPNSCGQVFSAPVVFSRAPRAAWARITDDFAGLEVTFDAAVRSENSDADWSSWCKLLPQERSLGTGPRCSVVDAKSIRILFGPNATVLPGDALVVPSWARATVDAVDSLASALERVVVLPALLPVIPQVTQARNVGALVRSP
jgi:hypothetical protein